MLKEVAADNLVTVKVECTKSGFADTFSATWLSNTIGNVIVGAGIIVNPMVVNGYKPSKNTLVNDVEKRKTTTHMMLAVFQKHLHGLKRLYGNDRFVVIRVEILVTVLVVLFVLMLI